ncbi:hypothetical protein ACU686_12085 [Yinghuangia aomiensis]
MHAGDSTQHDQAAESKPSGDKLPAVATRLEAEAAAAVASLRRQAALLHARDPDTTATHQPL